MIGTGMPIIFESGAGNDASVWNELLHLLRKDIAAPLITYDRAGFGKSGIDTSNVNLPQEVHDLEMLLSTLGFEGPCVFVAHSLGGNYAMKFINNNKYPVKAAIFIDVVTPYFMTEERARQTKALFLKDLDVIKAESLGFYHLVLNYEHTSSIMRQVSRSINIPLTIIGSGQTPFEGADRDMFIAGLKQFAGSGKDRRYVFVDHAQHHVFYDEPQLVSDEIVRLYKRICTTLE
ncbi:alpha/beta fold hydrolase [Sphingobacterium deserti]|uniref:Alpha/beta hydrolase fold protein n=1 Tax=Sphingobacterium deserti TaxID=1229276 RepID=A0A0B8T406_9SPHI|nr:alpha/beta hydrolase [Sphingobacterium deserti]KGE16051.1 alpha/beta hydrolase fold protein [Sphingobacterium deserti]